MHIPVFLSGALMGVSLLSAASATAGVADSGGEGGSCTAFIDALPTITAPGRYCLHRDLTAAITSGSAISIAADDVTLDCGDFRIGGAPAAWSSATTGVHADSNRRGAIVRGCQVRGFGRGIVLLGANSLVERNRVESSVIRGIDMGSGSGAIVRHNIVLNTGGGSSAVGINANASAMAYVTDNEVIGVHPADTSLSRSAIGISVMSGVVRGNQVSGLLAGRPEDNLIGIRIGARGLVSGNAVIQTGATLGKGIDGGSSAQTVCRDNDVQRYTTAYTRCSLVGHNSTLY